MRFDRRCAAAGLLTLTLLGTAAPAQAQAVTLCGGYRAGSGFRDSSGADAPIDLRSTAALSAAYEWPNGSSRPLQLLLSHQRTRLDIGASSSPGAPSSMPLRLSYLHLGGLNFFEGGTGGPYVAGGIGVTLMNPGLPGTSSRVRGSLNVGLGYQWPLGPSLALRTELRGYATLIRSDGAFFCSGGCVVQIKGDTLTQLEGLVGLSMAF